MKDSTSDNLAYCKNLVKTQDYPRFLQCAFLPEALQVVAYSYYALDAELRHIHQHVTEEMIGHIRYAWWSESVEALPIARQHPVLMALSQTSIDQSILVKLVESYREIYPGMPLDAPELVIENARWQKAGHIIAKHRARHEKNARLWLIVKLLFV